MAANVANMQRTPTTIKRKAARDAVKQRGLDKLRIAMSEQGTNQLS